MRQVKVADTYEGVCKQFRAAMTLVHCLEQRMDVSTREVMAERRARGQLESERSMNARLTAELEVAEARIEQLLLQLEIEKTGRKRHKQA